MRAYNFPWPHPFPAVIDMKIDGKAYRTIWLAPDGWSVEIIDQTRLPHELVIVPLKSAEDAARAILTMQVRGAPLIGATAAYGLAMAIREDASDEAIDQAIAFLAKQRPTAINLRWALEEMRRAVQNLPREARVAAAYKRAAEICDEDVETCRMIGVHGLEIIKEIAAEKKPGERGRGADPLQRRLARLRRLGHGDLAHLPGARRRHPGACVGRRDAPAQPGRVADGLRAGAPRRAAHDRRRQRRRASDAARARSTSSSSAPTASPPTATSPTRSAPT